MNREECINALYKKLISASGISIKEIMSIAECKSRTSAYSYIKALRDRGNIITESKDGRTVIFELKKNSSLTNHKFLSKDDCYSYTILNFIKAQPAFISDIVWMNRDSSQRKKEELRRKEKRKENLSSASTHLTKVPYSDNTIRISYTKIRELTLSLEEDGFIEKDCSPSLIKNKSQKYKATSPDTLFISQNNPSELIDTILELESIITGHLYFNELSSICNKLKAIVENPEDITNNQKRYLSYGKQFSGTKRISDFFSIINNIDYKHHQVIFSMNDETCITAIIACILYSMDTDSVYVMCINPNKDDAIFFINALRIKKCTEYLNISSNDVVFDTAKYINIYTKLFGPEIDTLEPHHVKIKFQNVFNVRNKILQLCNIRNHRNDSNTDKPSHARISDINSQYFIYEDEIIGLYSFASYLRKFGSACEVIEPSLLRNMMINTCLRTMQRYQELNDGDCK